MTRRRFERVVEEVLRTLPPEFRRVDPPLLPDRIMVFMGSLLEACGTEAELREEIRKTVLHELAHFFGFDEERLAELGYG